MMEIFLFLSLLQSKPATSVQHAAAAPRRHHPTAPANIIRKPCCDFSAVRHRFICRFGRYSYSNECASSRPRHHPLACGRLADWRRRQDPGLCIPWPPATGLSTYEDISTDDVSAHEDISEAVRPLTVADMRVMRWDDQNSEH